MSYCRWSETSEVYLYESASDGRFICCGCGFPAGMVAVLAKRESEGDIVLDGLSVSLRTRELAIQHLWDHIAAFHKVEMSAIDRLQQEIDTGEPYWQQPVRRIK